MSIQTGEKGILTLLMTVYFLATPLISIFGSFLGTEAAQLLINLAIGILLVLCIAKKGVQRIGRALLVLLAASAVIILGIILHPDYSEWYNHPTYGITSSFLNLQSGIWAVLIFSLYDNTEDLLTDLKIAALMVFLAYSYKFLGAMRRGYWLVAKVDGSGFNEAPYDMEFGYRMLFTAAVFGASGFVKNIALDKILFLVCIVFIFLGGSRGPIVWAVILPLIIACVKFKNYERRKKRKVLAVLAVFVLLLLIVWINWDPIRTSLLSLMDSYGIKSRTLRAVLDGSFYDSNGRNYVYMHAFRRIGTGGLLGHGFYGDRVYIGQFFRWGYPHNIFLEFFIQFGYLGGTLLSLLLAYGVFIGFRRCKTPADWAVFLSLLVCSARLLVSGSFWYESKFWALAAFLLQFESRSIMVLQAPKMVCTAYSEDG